MQCTSKVEIRGGGGGAPIRRLLYLDCKTRLIVSELIMLVGGLRLSNRINRLNSKV